VLGILDLPFIFNNEQTYHSAIVVTDNTSFPGGMLLGKDFLGRYNACITFKGSVRGYVEIKNNKFKFKQVKSSVNVCASTIENNDVVFRSMSIAKASQNIDIPKSSALYCTLRAPFHLNNKAVVVSPSKQLNNLIIPRVLAIVRNGTIPVTLINCSDRTIKINVNTPIAKIELASQEEDPDIIRRNSSVTIPDKLKKTSSNIENGKTHSDDCSINFIKDCFSRTNISSNGSNFSSLIDSLDLSHLSVNKRSKLVDLLSKHRKAISINDEIGKVSILKHNIVIDEKQIPLFTPQYRVPYASKQIIEEHVQTMLKQGIIEPCSSPWSSPVLLIRKRDNSFRFCVDYRRVNTTIKNDLFPIPRIDDILESVSGACVFSTLDMKSSFHQIELDENSRDFTAFRTASGSYRYCRLPQGLSTSPAGFQRACNFAFNKQIGRFLYCYIDDLVIFSKNFDEHLVHLEEILSQIELTGFKIGLEKCQFAASSVKYLGHIIDGDGIHVDSDKIKAIAEMKPPSDVKGIRSFLGACGYYRKFIKSYSTIAAPLTELTKKSVPFKWTDKCQHAFDELKNRLTSAPILVYPDYNKPFILHCDASNTAVGGVLNQLHENGEKPVGYFSRKLRGPEINYTITEREALAIYESVKFFTPYLWLNRFKIVTDHIALKFIFKHKNTVPRITRWAMYLSDFDYEI
jgi:hypothetical protein